MRQLRIGFLSVFLLACTAVANESPVAVFKAEDDYQTVKENIEMAITDRGMLLSSVLHISDMLNRTAKDLGFDKIFLKAESIEFCSAALSHRMVKADPTNLVICPFTISVYVKADEPDQVYVAFQRQTLAGESREESKAVNDMLRGIVADALE